MESDALTGKEQLILCICICIYIYKYQDTSIDKIYILMYENGGQIYGRHKITKRCRNLRMSQKRSSKVAYAFFRPIPIPKLGWLVQDSTPLPLGVQFFPIHKLIYVNETRSISNQYL